MRKCIIICLNLIILLAACQSTFSPSTGRDWTKYRGPFANGATDETISNPAALEDSTAILWEINVGQGHGAVTVQGNRIYVYGNKKCKLGTEMVDCDVIACHSAKTGREIWHHAYASEPGTWPGPYSTPVVDDNRVYTFDRHGKLLCLNIKDGHEIWSTDIQNFGFENDNRGNVSSPVIHDNTLFLRIGSSGIAFDKETGENIWAGNPIEGMCYASPVLIEFDGQPAVAFAGVDSLRILDIHSMQFVYRYPCEQQSNSPRSDPMLLKDGRLLVDGLSHTLLFDLTKNPVDTVWTRRNTRSGFQGFVKYENLLFSMGTSHGDEETVSRMKCIYWETGERL